MDSACTKPGISTHQISILFLEGIELYCVKFCLVAFTPVDLQHQAPDIFNIITNIPIVNSFEKAR